MSTANMPVDFGGAEGGRLALAFAAGCAAAYAFLIGIVNSPLKSRIKELEADVADERKRCDAMEARLVHRIEQLETLLLTHTSGDLRQAMQRVVSEQRTERDR